MKAPPPEAVAPRGAAPRCKTTSPHTRAPVTPMKTPSRIATPTCAKTRHRPDQPTPAEGFVPGCRSSPNRCPGSGCSRGIGVVSSMKNRLRALRDGHRPPAFHWHLLAPCQPAHQGAARPLRTLRPDAPVELERFVNRLLVKDPLSGQPPPGRSGKSSRRSTTGTLGPPRPAAARTSPLRCSSRAISPAAARVGTRARLGGCVPRPSLGCLLLNQLEVSLILVIDQPCSVYKCALLHTVGAVFITPEGQPVEAGRDPYVVEDEHLGVTILQA